MATPVVIDDTMLNPRHLAEMTGFKIGTVYAWRKRRESTLMPEPDAIAGRTPLWRADRIVPWLRATNRLM